MRGRVASPPHADLVGEHSWNFGRIFGLLLIHQLR